MILLKGHTSGTSVWSIAFTPDSQHLASAGNDGTLRLWDLRSGDGKVLQRVGVIGGLAVSPTGEWLVYSILATTIRLRLKDNTADVIGADGYAFPAPHAFSPEGDLLLAGGHHIRPFNAKQWAPLPPWGGGSESYPQALVFHPGGEVLATAHRMSRPNTVRLWEVGTWAPLGELDHPTYPVRSLAFSPNGRHLAAASGPTVWVWDVASGDVVWRHQIDRRHFQSCAFSPDGRLLATAHNDARVRLYDTATWAETAAYDWGVGPVTNVAFAPDGMKAAASGKRGLIVVWDVDI